MSVAKHSLLPRGFMLSTATRVTECHSLTRQLGHVTVQALTFPSCTAVSKNLRLGPEKSGRKVKRFSFCLHFWFENIIHSDKNVLSYIRGAHRDIATSARKISSTYNKL